MLFEYLAHGNLGFLDRTNVMGQFPKEYSLLEKPEDLKNPLR